MRVDVDGPLGAEWMNGRTALVTGGGGREGGPGTIGWAVSRVLARHGARVAVLDRDPTAADRTVSQIRKAGGTAIPVTADVTSDGDCARAVAEASEALGGLDTLVNNVAAWSAAELFDVEPERFDELMTLNLKAAWLMTRNAIEVMQPGGAIVNITSVAARRAGTIYGLGKAALESMTSGASYLLAERGIRINAVELGALWTAGVAENLPPEARDPVGRWWRSRPRGTAGTPPRPCCSWPPSRLAGYRVRCSSSTAGERPGALPGSRAGGGEIVNGRVALVTGCGKPDGGGQAIARALAADGAAVVVTDRMPTGVLNRRQEIVGLRTAGFLERARKPLSRRSRRPAARRCPYWETSETRTMSRRWSTRRSSATTGWTSSSTTPPRLRASIAT